MTGILRWRSGGANTASPHIHIHRRDGDKVRLPLDIPQKGYMNVGMGAILSEAKKYGNCA